jgi:hypothetical protein
MGNRESHGRSKKAMKRETRRQAAADARKRQPHDIR